MSSGKDTRSGPRPKVERVAEKYGFGGVGDELERRWVGEGGEQQSVRALADWFNERIVRAAIDGSELFTLSDDVGAVYDAIAGEADGDGTLIRTRLEQNDIDVEELRSDFVSHQTIYRYLTDHREAEQPEPSDEDRIESGRETIQRLRGRTTAVTERTVTALRDSDRLEIDGFTVLTDIQIICEACGRSHDVSTLLDEGGCPCQS